jgi:hypothetical protein
VSGNIIPTSYTINADVSGSLDVGLDDIQIKELPVITLNSTSSVDLGLNDIQIKELPVITLNSTSSVDLGLNDIQIKELPVIALNSASTLTSNSTVDLGLDDIRVKELPPIDLRLQASVKPTRVHFPLNVKLAICSMGHELLSFTVCGETMVVIEDYVPHRTEECS